MKKLTLTLIFITLISTSILAQISVTKLDYTPINNNDIISFSSTAEAQATLGFLVTNNGATTTDIFIRCESITNATGANFQLCFGDECLPSVTAGGIYPSRAVTLVPGASNGVWDHFWNSDTGSGTFPMDYVFTFFQLDASGNPTSNTVTFTYRYNPNLSNSTFDENSFVSFNNEIITDLFTFEIKKDLTLSIFDITGKKILINKLQSGTHNIDFSSFNTGVYIVNFKDNSGNNLVRKVVKK
ncbi:MAG: T9SS type A sorting domain-containing protein [Flavobacterium haoranii]